MVQVAERAGPRLVSGAVHRMSLHHIIDVLKEPSMARLVGVEYCNWLGYLLTIAEYSRRIDETDIGVIWKLCK